jgi:hypothetical protein
VLNVALELRNRCLTDFNIDPLHAACSFGNVDLVLILGVGRGGEDLGGKLDRISLGVLRLCSLSGCLFKCRAAAC